MTMRVSLLEQLKVEDRRPAGFANSSILLVLPVPFCRDSEGKVLVEEQAGNGLDRWADNFQNVVIASPLKPNNSLDSGKIYEYINIEAIQSANRVEFIPLPWAYELKTFLASYYRTRALLAEKIRQCDYLLFGIGGLVGDWPAVAALEALRQKKSFSVWTDRVEYSVIQNAYRDSRGLQRIYRRARHNLIISPLMKALTHHIIARADLGLFHGRDCFDAYSPHCRLSYLVHNIHLKPENRIDSAQLQTKLHRVRSGGPLRIVYAGRVAGMKGPFDWIQAMAILRDSGVAFRASWLGDGPLLAGARAEVVRLNLSDLVDFPGFVRDRSQLLNTLRDADIFVFCHKTLESPRCLIEALMSGSPILGYDSPYPRDLLDDLAPSVLVARDDITALAERMADLNRDRGKLAELIQKSYELGAHFSDSAVFRHRSDLIKYHLGAVQEAKPIAGSDSFGPLAI